MAKIVVKETTKTSITVYLGELDTTYAKDDRYIRWYLMPEATPFETTYIDAYASESDTVTITGLTANTTYEIVATSYWTDGNGESGTTSYTLTVKTAGASVSGISLFSWVTSNGTASAEQTKKAYTAVTTKGDILDFSYLVWNDMVEKLNEINAYLGYEWIGTYGSLAETKMTPSDKNITAKRYNALLHNIWANGGTNESSFFKLKREIGNAILGSYFTDIVTYLNNIIDNL